MTTRSIYFCLAAVLLIPLLAVAQRQRPPAQQPQEQEGTELQIRLVMEDGRALTAQVMVRLITQGGVPLAEKASNDRGQVAFSMLGPGNYALQVTGAEVQDFTSEKFSIERIERVHFEVFQIKLRPSDSQYVPAPTPTVSAAELNVPDKARKEFEKGNEKMKEGKNDKAREHFTKAVEIYPAYPAAHNNLGVLLMQAGNSTDARAEFERALANDPNSGSAALNLARLAVKDKDWAKAEEMVKRALSSQPSNAEALAMLSMAAFGQGKFEDCIAAARKTHGFEHAKFPVVHFFAARSFAALNKVDEAMVEYKVFLKEAPADSKTAVLAQQELAKLQGGN